MDKKFGPPWHIVAGKFFSYEVTYEVRRASGSCVLRSGRLTEPCLQCKHLLYLYVGGTTGVLLGTTLSWAGCAALF